MYNIWGFLLQTISVSTVAAILLIVKHILADKLSPRWQYGAWILLMFRIIIPINLISYIIPELPVWIETSKAVCEKQLVSNYTSVYEPISLTHVLPVIDKTPQSITDWLFVIYTFGIIICLLRYMISYISLRVVLRRGTPGDGELEKRILVLCENHGLRPCRIISVSGITSAFICGVFRPVLVVPAGMHVDDKILLHELLHLKYWDTLQNIGWCILRSLHWCNPFIQYAIYRIENDMESLCDQRVLERLEGEERRAYGTILLAMANSKYAHIPGTSSISNGGKNISRRITAIVRFKKYPKGMALVSVCILFVLFIPTMIGNAQTFNQSDYTPVSVQELNHAMAVARLNRCTTIAGALDTYAKGFMLENGAYIVSASSLSKHEELEAAMRKNAESGVYEATYLEAGEYGDCIQDFKEYQVFNLDKISDYEYRATLAFPVLVYMDKTEETFGKNEYNAYLFIPVTVKYEDAWVVEETGTRSIYNEVTYNKLEPDFPAQKKYYAESEIGSIVFRLQTKYTVDNTTRDENGYLISTQFDESPQTDAVFNNYECTKFITYTYNSSYNKKPGTLVELAVIEPDFEDDTYYPETDSTFQQGVSEDGYWHITKAIGMDWDGIVEDECGGGHGGSGVDFVDLPAYYEVQVFWDEELVDKLILKEAAE